MSAVVEAATEIRPFHPELAQDAIDDRWRRIAATRWPSKELATYVVEKGKSFLVLVE